jgi:hypothetical protein
MTSKQYSCSGCTSSIGCAPDAALLLLPARIRQPFNTTRQPFNFGPRLWLRCPGAQVHVRI